MQKLNSFLLLNKMILLKLKIMKNQKKPNHNEIVTVIILLQKGKNIHPIKQKNNITDINNAFLFS